MRDTKYSVGIIGGLGLVASADIVNKMTKIAADDPLREACEIVFEQRLFAQSYEGIDTLVPEPGNAASDPNDRKLYCFDLIRQFEQSALGAVLLPCFISHTFIDELQAETSLPVLNMMHALQVYLAHHQPAVKKIGILTSDYVRKNALFEKYLEIQGYTLVYPDDATVQAGVMHAVYGKNGIKNGVLTGEPINLLVQACDNLLAQGAGLCIPGITEISVVAEALAERGMPMLDTNQIYTDFAMAFDGAPRVRQFKIGVIGGVGPAATVDFMEKIIRNTPASRDQDHIKLVVEHNPQIPDRTANLIGSGVDPTVALYAAGKRLEADNADVIAIPCNTAHAFVKRIQSSLSIPIVHMLFETVDYISRHHADKTSIGLLATSGTLASRVYHDVIAATHFQLMTPDQFHQDLVMRAIYGPTGVKAGFNTGQGIDDVMQSIMHLVQQGAEIIILGCTELPLLVAQDTHFMVGNREIVILDPTEILARRCVALAGR